MPAFPLGTVEAPSFERWMFGDFREMEIEPGTFLMLLLVASLSSLCCDSFRKRLG